LQHANLSITDGVYGILSGTDVKGKISGLGKKSDISQDGRVRKLKLLVERLLLKLGEMK
jgi:hypothetical protein